jgi:hypothetical protein
MREIRALRATWRGLETWHGRDASTWTGAPVLDPTDERGEETDRSNGTAPLLDSTIGERLGIWRFSEVARQTVSQRGATSLKPPFRRGVTCDPQTVGFRRLNQCAVTGW